jgi:DnaJ-class molecular chaperone
MPVDTILYDRLEVQPNVDENELKKAYRKMSMKWHPDKNQNNKEEATKKFQEISEAYTILSDKDKRQMYDQIGINILKSNGEAPPFNPNDIFEQFMGGFNFHHRQQQREEENCVIQKEVSLEDIYNQRTINIEYKQKVYCDNCQGTGCKDNNTSKCSVCQGNGRKIQIIRQGPMIQQIVMPCNNCNGTGQFIEENNKCMECKGNKYIVRDKMVEVPLKQGLMNGNKVQLNKKGNIYKNGKTDLIIVINVKPHNIFKRDGNDLHMELNIYLYQDLFGFNKLIKHLDGREIVLNYSHQTNGECVCIVENEGMIDLKGNKGNLYVHIKTNYSNMDKLNDSEKEYLKQLLIKLNFDEYIKETELTKNISKYKKLKLKKIKYQEHKTQEQDDNEQEDMRQGQCVQQ